MEQQRAALPDWAYPAEDDVPETLLHLRLRTMLYVLVQYYLAERGIRALTGSEQFMYWIEGNPQRALAPDLFVVLGEDPGRDVRVWQTWNEGRAPHLAVEIVSGDVHKDYELGPVRYAEAGVRELIIFDPQDGPARVRWQVYRRNAAGDLVHVARTAADRVRSEVLDCHVRWVTDTQDGLPQLRLGVGHAGEVLVPTEAEAERAAKEQERAAKEQERAAKEQERAAKEQERAAKEQERAAKEQERAAKEQERAHRKQLEAEVAALKARLAARDED